jgi:hypothetical protein
MFLLLAQNQNTKNIPFFRGLVNGLCSAFWGVTRTTFPNVSPLLRTAASMKFCAAPEMLVNQRKEDAGGERQQWICSHRFLHTSAKMPG